MVTGWQLDVEPELPGPVVVGGGTIVDPPVDCDLLGPVVCEPPPPGPEVCELPPPGPEVAQVPGLGGAVAHAHTKKETMSV